MQRPSSAGRGAQSGVPSTREKLRSTLQRLTPTVPAAAPTHPASFYDDADEADAEVAGVNGDDAAEDEVDDDEALTDDVDVDEFDDGGEEAADDDDAAAADADERKEQKEAAAAAESPSPSPRSFGGRPASPAYAQYISRHRSRYSYSPTSHSPRSPHSPSAATASPAVASVSRPGPGRVSPAHRPSSRSSNLEPPSPSSSPPPPRRASNMSITITDSHSQNPAAAAAPASSPRLSSTSPIPGPSPKSASLSPSKRQRGRSQSTLSSPSPTQSPSSPTVSRLQVELAKALSVISERENDIRLAAQIGEMVMEENEKLERLMGEMRVDMAEREERELQAREEARKLRLQMEQLRKQNMTLVTASQPAADTASSSSSLGSEQSQAKTPSSASSLQDFLRQELSSSSSSSTSDSSSAADGYTGDLTADLRSFIRRLHAERRNTALVVGALRESVSRLEEEKKEKEKELEKAAEALRSMREREDALQREMAEMRERRREEELEGMNERQREIMGMKRNNERVVFELEHELREEREERESQQRLRQEAEETISEMKERMEQLKREMTEKVNAALKEAKESEEAAPTPPPPAPTAAAPVKKKKRAAKPSVSSPTTAAPAVPMDAAAQAAAELIAAGPDSQQPQPPSSSPVAPLSVKLPEGDATQEMPVLDSAVAAGIESSFLSPASASGDMNALPTPSGSASDEEHRQLLKQLHHYVTDVRQQLTSIRVEEERKNRKSSLPDAADERTDERKLTPEEEERLRREEDERETELARQKERELKEKLKQKARERRREKERTEKERELQREKERRAEEEQDRQRAEQAEAERKRRADEASRPPPISVDHTAATRTSRTDSYSGASQSPVSATSTHSSENLTFSSVSTLPTAANPALSLPTAVPSFTASPSFTLPSFSFSAIDHFTLTHIQSLLTQMWGIAVSLLSSTPTKTAAWYDNQHPACLHCHQRFSLLHRKHHCRLCGGLYCDNCSSHKVTIEKFGFKGVRVCNTCFPEVDTRVLTDTGFLFLSEIEARLGRGEAVLYGCYEIATQSIVYSPGKLVIVPAPARWVDFTQAATRRLWGATSDDYSSAAVGAGRAAKRANHISIRTTPLHSMYVQLGHRSGSAKTSCRVRLSGKAPVPPHKMFAEELAPGFACTCAADGVKRADCPHGYTTYRLFTGAPSGISHADVMSVNDTALDSPVNRLGLSSDDQLNAFLELYGYWLGDGTMIYDGGALRFAPKKPRDRDYLLGLIERLRLKPTEWTVSEHKAAGCLVVTVTAERWWRYFDEEYGLNYVNSQYYNREAAVAKLGNRRSVVPARRKSLSAATTESSTPRSGAGQRRSSVSFSSRSRTAGNAEKDMELLPLTPPSTTRALASRSASVCRTRDASEPMVQCSGVDGLAWRGGAMAVDEDEDEAMPAAVQAEHGDGVVCCVCDSTSSSGANPLLRCTGRGVDGLRCTRGLHLDCCTLDGVPAGGWCCSWCISAQAGGAADDEPPFLTLHDQDEKKDDKKERPPAEDLELDEDDEDDEPEEPDEETPAKSCKWFWCWVLKRLEREQLRLVIEGLRQADGRSARTEAQRAAGSDISGMRRISTSSVAFRDALIQACVHAGYSAHFSINTRAGSVRGYMAVPADYCMYKQEEMEQLLQDDPSRVFRPVASHYDSWWIDYSVSTSALLSAADVRYDGKALQLREKKEHSQGFVALRSDGRLVRAAMQRELGAAIGMGQQGVAKFLQHGRQRNRTSWQISTAAYEERAHVTGRRPSSRSTSPAASSSASATTEMADAYAERDGRVWCVEVQHGDHLIVVQRAHRNAAGIVTKASRPVITGNCFVMARTVVLCRKAVETGQVEYKEVVKQAEKYAAEEREKARLEAVKKAIAASAAGAGGAEVVTVQPAAPKKEKTVKVVSTPGGTTTLSFVSPPLSPDNASSTAAATADALHTPPRKEKKKETPISPALVPYFAGSGKDKSPAKDRRSSSQKKSEPSAATEADVSAAEIPAVDSATSSSSGSSSSGSGSVSGSVLSSGGKRSGGRMMAMIEAERDKQRLEQQQAQAALPHVNAAAVVAPSSRLPPSYPASRRTASTSAASSPVVGPFVASSASSGAAGAKEPRKVKSLGLGTRPIL